MYSLTDAAGRALSTVASYLRSAPAFSVCCSIIHGRGTSVTATTHVCVHACTLTKVQAGSPPQQCPGAAASAPRGSPCSSFTRSAPNRPPRPTSAAAATHSAPCAEICWSTARSLQQQQRRRRRRRRRRRCQLRPLPCLTGTRSRPHCRPRVSDSQPPSGSCSSSASSASLYNSARLSEQLAQPARPPLTIQSSAGGNKGPAWTRSTSAPSSPAKLRSAGELSNIS